MTCQVYLSNQCQNPGRLYALAVRSVVSYQATSKPHAAGTRAAVLFAGWPASSGTIGANPRRRRGARVVSFHFVGWRSSNPSPCWPPLGTVELRPHMRSCPQRSRTLRQGSVAARGRSGNYESHGLRGARPLAPGCSSGSFPNRCRPSEAIVFPMVCAAHCIDLSPRSLARPGWPSSSGYRP